jgi:hypothetical protein
MKLAKTKLDLHNNALPVAKERLDKALESGSYQQMEKDPMAALATKSLEIGQTKLAKLEIPTTNNLW